MRNLLYPYLLDLDDITRAIKLYPQDKDKIFKAVTILLSGKKNLYLYDLKHFPNLRETAIPVSIDPQNITKKEFSQISKLDSVVVELLVYPNDIDSLLDFLHFYDNINLGNKYIRINNIESEFLTIDRDTLKLATDFGASPGIVSIFKGHPNITKLITPSIFSPNRIGTWITLKSVQISKISCQNTKYYGDLFTLLVQFENLTHLGIITQMEKRGIKYFNRDFLVKQTQDHIRGLHLPLTLSTIYRIKDWLPNVQKYYLIFGFKGDKFEDLIKLAISGIDLNIEFIKIDPEIEKYYNLIEQYPVTFNQIFVKYKIQLRV